MRTSDSRVRDKGFELLVSTPFASQLQTLLLSGNRIGCSGVRAMIRSPYLTKLELLDLDGNDLVSISECMEELSQTTNLPMLKTIDVGSQEDLFGDTVNLALACSVHLPIEARRSVFEKIRIEKVRQEAEKHQVNIDPGWSKEELFCAIWEKKQSRGQVEDDESYEASNPGGGEEGS